MDSKTTKKKSAGRLTKAQRYLTERKEILDKVLGILGIDEQNDTFYLHDIEDTDKEQQLIETMDECRKYFKAGLWTCNAKRGKINKVYLSFIKSLFKEMNINMTMISIKNSKGEFLKKGYVVYGYAST